MHEDPTPSDVDELFPVSDELLQSLHERLTRQAATDGLLDVAYRTVDSPLGQLMLATTERGIVRVAFAVEGFDEVLTTLSTTISPRILRAPARLDVAAREVDEYLTGRRRTFDLPLDYSMSRGFRRTVQQYLPTIEYGSTATYRSVAEGVGNPKAVRAVGTACATNPLPIIVPCHRVIRTDGTLGGYIGGLQAKDQLLDLESAHAIQ